MIFVTSEEIGKLLCRVLGIDHNDIRAITLRCHAGEAASVIVDRFLHHEETQQVCTILEHYRVVPVGGDDA